MLQTLKPFDFTDWQFVDNFLIEWQTDQAEFDLTAC